MQSKKAFDFAADITKQWITLAAAIITLTVTFSKDSREAAVGLLGVVCLHGEHFVWVR